MRPLVLMEWLIFLGTGPILKLHDDPPDNSNLREFRPLNVVYFPMRKYSDSPLPLDLVLSISPVGNNPVIFPPLIWLKIIDRYLFGDGKKHCL